MRSLGMKLLAFAAVAMFVAPVFAQTDTNGTKADVAFELHPGKLISSPMGEKMDFKSRLEDIAAKSGQFDFSKVDRVVSGLVAPADMENLEKVQSGAENKMEFFVRLEFSDAAEASKLIDEAKEENGGVTEKGGKTYYAPPAEATGMPEGTVMYRVSDKVVELASEGFAYRTVEMPLTDALAASWKTMPDEAIKLSIDGVNARGLLKSLAEEGKKNLGGNPLAGAVMDLFPTMDNINLSIDLASANLLTMKMVGNDEETAGDINDGFKSMVTMVKPTANAGLGMIEAQAPDAAAVFGKVINGMDVKQDGKDVTLNIPRPEGFADATEEVIPIVQAIVFQMMMGGAAPNPGGGF